MCQQNKQRSGSYRWTVCGTDIAINATARLARGVSCRNVTTDSPRWLASEDTAGILHLANVRGYVDWSIVLVEAGLRSLLRESTSRPTPAAGAAAATERS